ncbi:hypothetical protein [Legionella fallonii]|uniref:Uncharacterized protein n=1 Tax=Legionella fallonii LLAP-10 TaxID=1212491 RepID=A0A098G1J0_9GAMM|nr:hypothetical protein [Legionella fallonii]CEG56353.1 conserved membrane protein of unknown function [Legionella fallonii LLAP-10]
MCGKNNTKKINRDTVVLLQSLIVLLGAPFFLFIDSPWITPYCPYGQDVTNIIMVFIYSWFLFVARGRLYWIILLMTISSLFAEAIGSLLLTLYQYRLKNIPMYIPLGHAVIYATVYHVCRQPLIWKHHKAVEKLLAKVIFVIVFMSLFVLNDVGGFITYIIFLIIFRQRTQPIFYLTMFVMVYYIELCGTVCSTWAWYVVVGNHPSYPTIGYTPSGMAGLYILIDLTSNSIYYYLQRIKKYLNTLGLNFKLGNRAQLMEPT